MQARVGLLVLDVMPIYMIIALDIVMIIRFSINCPTVICLPTICYAFEREASSENYGPRVYLNHILKSKNTFVHFYLSYFILCFYLSITMRFDPCN